MLSAALEEAEAAKVDLPLVRRATAALKELRRKAARIAKKGRSGRGDPAHRRSASPHRQRRSSRSASPGGGGRSADGRDGESNGPVWQGSSESSGDFSIPAGKAGRTSSGELRLKDTGGSSPKTHTTREADRGSSQLSSEPSMSLSLQSSLSEPTASAPPPALPHPPDRQHHEKHPQPTAAASGKPQLVRDSVGELASAVARKVEAIEKERERQREEKRQLRSKEAAERAAAAAAAAAQEKAEAAAAKAEKTEKDSSGTPKALGRGMSFFGRKATPVSSPAGSGAGGEREWRWLA